MADSLSELVERGRALEPVERERLVEILLESLVEPAAPDIEAAWDDEIERRVAAHKAGETELFDLDAVLDEARRIAP